MRALNQKLDVDRKILDDQKLNNVDGAAAIVNGSKLSEDWYYMLVEKTGGDAGLRVNSGERATPSEARWHHGGWVVSSRAMPPR